MITDGFMGNYVKITLIVGYFMYSMKNNYFNSYLLNIGAMISDGFMGNCVYIP